MKKTVIAAALGECVHVAGVMNFLCLAYWRHGRTIEKLGINNLSVGELTHYVNEGILEH